MAVQIQFSKGIIPLGVLTVAAAGTPTLLNTNIGQQGQSATTLRASATFRQFTVAALPTNTGKVYVVWVGNGSLGNSKATPKYVIDEIPAGQSRSYPNGSLLVSGGINLDQWAIDVDTNGEGAACYGTAA